MDTGIEKCLRAAGVYLVMSKATTTMSNRTPSLGVGMYLASMAMVAMLLCIGALLLALGRVIFLGVRFAVRKIGEALAGSRFTVSIR